MGIFSRFKGISRTGWCWVSSRALKLIYGAFMGLYRVVILFACVPRLPAKDKKPFCPRLCLFAWSACPCVLSACVPSCDRQKRRAALFGLLSFLGGGVWFLLVLVSEHCKRCGAFAKYPYFFYCVVGFNPSGGGACYVVNCFPK